MIRATQHFRWPGPARQRKRSVSSGRARRTRSGRVEWRTREPLRYLVGLGASLLLVLSLIHLPLEMKAGSAGRYAILPQEIIQPEHIAAMAVAEEETPKEAAPPVEQRPIETVAEVEEVIDEVEAGDAGEAAEEKGSFRRFFKRIAPAMAAAATLETPTEMAPMNTFAPDNRIFADELPRVRYMDLEYPRAAKPERIEGRVILSFLVETDGRAYDIEVLRPLHPACDAEAVRAIGEAIFKPGLRNEIKIPIRMYMILRFEFEPYS